MMRSLSSLVRLFSVSIITEPFFNLDVISCVDLVDDVAHPTTSEARMYIHDHPKPLTTCKA